MLKVRRRAGPWGRDRGAAWMMTVFRNDHSLCREPCGRSHSRESYPAMATVQTGTRLVCYRRARIVGRLVVAVIIAQPQVCARLIVRPSLSPIVHIRGCKIGATTESLETIRGLLNSVVRVGTRVPNGRSSAALQQSAAHLGFAKRQFAPEATPLTLRKECKIGGA